MFDLAISIESCSLPAAVSVSDGGTVGLALLPEIENASAFVAVDAARFGAAPGTVRVFEGPDMDALLSGRRRSAHEVALADLAEGKRLEEVVPFWRVVLPGSKVAQKLSCGPDHVAHLIALDAGAVTAQKLNAAINKALQAPDVAEKLSKLGMDPATGTPDNVFAGADAPELQDASAFSAPL